MSTHEIVFNYKLIYLLGYKLKELTSSNNYTKRVSKNKLEN